MSIQTQQLRAVIWPLLNPETGFLHLDRIAWPELERKAGEYDFAPVRAAIERAKSIKRYAMMSIEPVTPVCCADAIGGYVRLIEAMGREFGGEASIMGVDVCCPGGEALRGREELTAVARAFARAFPKARLFVPAGSRLDDAVCENKGLIVTPENIESAQGAWRNTPLRMAVDPTDEKAVAFAVEHHVSILACETLTGCNAPSHAGHRFAVRSVRVDDGERAWGSVRVSVTVANAGALPCYQPANFMLRLSGSDVADAREYPMPLCAADVGPGCERTADVTADIAGLSGGEYDVHVGLFMEGTSYSVSFGIEGRISDGYYEGRLILTL
ncbi:MAG: hypothetical protein Q4G52_01980 [Clostridia bacterium]|nr:hypothetical protein [Clostridia bacterium]